MPELTPDITKARTAAESATLASGQTGAEQYKVEDVLRQKLTEAYDSSKDIVQPLDTATQAYLGAPQAGREQYQNIFNPFQKENLVAQYIGNKALPMLSLSSMLGQRFGGIESAIGRGVGGFQALVAAKQAEAELKNQAYQNLLNEYVTGEQLGLAREKFEFDKSKKAGGGSNLTNMEFILQRDLDGDGLIGGIIPVAETEGGGEEDVYIDEGPEPVKVDFGGILSPNVVGASGMSHPSYYTEPASKTPAYMTDIKPLNEILGY